MERWIPALGFPAYEVSDLGRVRRAFCGCGARLAEPRIITGRPDQQGYLRVCLYEGKKRRDRYVARLILRSFTGEPPSPDVQAAHGDGNRQNNRLSNLRWAIPAENAHDKIGHGTHRRGSQIHFTRLDQSQVVEIRLLAHEGVSKKKIAKIVGSTPGNVHNIVNRVSWKHVA